MIYFYLFIFLNTQLKQVCAGLALCNAASCLVKKKVECIVRQLKNDKGRLTCFTVGFGLI